MTDTKPNEKPECPLIGKDGNIFNLIAIAQQTLRRAGLREQAAEMQTRVSSAKSYDEALAIISDYVDIV